MCVRGGRCWISIFMRGLGSESHEKGDSRFLGSLFSLVYFGSKYSRDLKYIFPDPEREDLLGRGSGGARASSYGTDRFQL